MTTQFTYRTQSQNKKVVMGNASEGRFFVDIYPEYSAHTSTKYNTKKEAEQRAAFNALRVNENDEEWQLPALPDRV